MFRCPSSRRSLRYACSGPRRGGGRAPSSSGPWGAAPGSAPVVALDLARREREAARVRRERSLAHGSSCRGLSPRRRAAAAGAGPSRPSAGSYDVRGWPSVGARARPPARRGAGAAAPPSKVRGPRDASPGSLPRRPTAWGPRAGEGTRKPQRQKTYTLRIDTDLRACRSDFDPRPLEEWGRPHFGGARGLIRRAVALATVYIKVGRTTI